MIYQNISLTTSSYSSTYDFTPYLARFLVLRRGPRRKSSSRSVKSIAALSELPSTAEDRCSVFEYSWIKYRYLYEGLGTSLVPVYTRFYPEAGKLPECVIEFNFLRLLCLDLGELEVRYELKETSIHCKAKNNTTKKEVHRKVDETGIIRRIMIKKKKIIRRNIAIAGELSYHHRLGTGRVIGKIAPEIPYYRKLRMSFGVRDEFEEKSPENGIAERRSMPAEKSFIVGSEKENIK
ncbi:hypothetical protein DFH27DRAFT_522803 [Peziza echinospora]|nr:hypothetical protein DFH27DRAFT_522803 [Peziza echinospora]